MNDSILKEILYRIDRMNKTIEFAAPASNEQIQHLADEVIKKSSRILPDDLRTLFLWHNGQAVAQSLSSNDDRRLLSIRESLKEWNYFLNSNNEFLEPFKPNWLPILTNGRSDYLVYDLDSGNLIAYWHDEIDRDIEFLSLIEWAKYIELDITRLKSKAGSDVLIYSRPEDMIISVYLEEGTKNFVLAKEIHTLAGLPILEIAKMLGSSGINSALKWDLSKAENCIERSRLVRIVEKVVDRIQRNGIKPVVSITSGDKAEKINPDSLESLSLRCLTP
ncbi:SMI1 / KNR4 family protein [Gimesia maris]|uniref:SMI1/KNR4 family protein n=1 Tax=Gimesia maris TaxID=122 RepID=UPI00118BE166|nr:SMI1/KNR4 family protein [Gimesia maris]QDT78549.1 SMI1 / KNR4 family protein [Gimesia maris]